MKLTANQTFRFSVDVVEALDRLARARGVSRNATIVAIVRGCDRATQTKLNDHELAKYLHGELSPREWSVAYVRHQRKLGHLSGLAAARPTEMTNALPDETMDRFAAAGFVTTGTATDTATGAASRPSAPAPRPRLVGPAGAASAVDGLPNEAEAEQQAFRHAANRGEPEVA